MWVFYPFRRLRLPLSYHTIIAVDFLVCPLFALSSVKDHFGLSKQHQATKNEGSSSLDAMATMVFAAFAGCAFLSFSLSLLGSNSFTVYERIFAISVHFVKRTIPMLKPS